MAVLEKLTYESSQFFHKLIKCDGCPCFKFTFNSHEGTTVNGCGFFTYYYMIILKFQYHLMHPYHKIINILLQP